MDYKELVESIKSFLSTYEKIRYGEYVGAPWPYNHNGPLVYTEPEAVLLDQAVEAITELLTRAEAAEARASDAERALRGMIASYFRVNEVAKKILNYSKDDNTPGDMRDDLKEASIMLFRIDESFRKAERATERAEKAERERDAAVKDLDGVAAAVDDLSDFIDEQIHPLIQYDTVCQSVGLGDMDGTPVFESDRLQFSYEDDGEEVVSSSIVVYHDYEFVSMEEEFGMWDSLEGEFLKLCKVTGNIHDEEDGHA